MTTEKMPDVAYLITGITERFDGVWDDYQWSDSRGTKYLRAESVEELLIQIRDQIEFCKKHDHTPALDKSMMLIDKFLGEK